MAVCGSELLIGASCTCTREGPIGLGGLTVSQRILLKVSLRIVKAIFGSQQPRALTSFATTPSPRFPAGRVCPKALQPFWRRRMEWFGLAALGECPNSIRANYGL